MGLVVALPAFFHSSATSYDVGVSGGDTAALTAALSAAGSAHGVTVHVHPSRDDVAAAKAAVSAGTWDAALVDGTVVAETTDAGPVPIVQDAYQAVTVQQRLTAAGLSAQQAGAALSVPAPPISTTRSAESGQRQAIATAAIVVLFAQLVSYCTWVANGVVEEKASRVVELLLAAVRPIQLLTGKLLGIGALAVGQVALIGVVALVVGRAAGTLTIGGAAVVAVLEAFGGFVLGFLVFAALAAALASTVSRQEELTGVLFPLNTVLLVAYLGSFAAASTPDGTFARVLSYVPPVSALAMPARLARGSASLLDALVAAVLLLALAAVILVVAARVYRAAILHTGSRVSLRRAWRGEAVPGLG